MAFSGNTVKKAWKRAGGAYPPNPSYCECTRIKHDHGKTLCNKRLIWGNRGGEGVGKWEAHSITGRYIDSASDCHILCWNCHNLTF